MPSPTQPPPHTHTQPTRDNEEFTDISLAWEDGLSIKAHQAILPAWSPQTNTPIPWSKLEVCSSNTKIVSTYFGHFREKREVQYRRSFDKVDLFDSRHLLLNIFCSRKVTLSINIAFVYFFWHISSSQQETRSVNACTTWETYKWSSVQFFWG